MLQLRKTTYKTDFHLCDRCANAPFFFVKRQKLAFHCVMELAEVRTADGVANGDAHIRTSFYEHPFINGEINRPIPFGFVRKNPGHKGGNAVEAVWQQPERSLMSLGNDAQHIGLLRENLGG
jgi:hypothetical protein